MDITDPLTSTGLQDLEVLHLIGEELPAALSSQPFVLYQNIFPPTATPASGVILPVSAFTEEQGTFIDHAGEMHRLQKAVQAPGSSLPSWQILCRIAQKLEVQGFDFTDEVQIRAEMESTKIVSAETDASILKLFQPTAVDFPSNRAGDHAYMGFPLRTRVAGFQVLYPEPPLKNKE